MAQAVQQATNQSVQVAFVDQGYTGDDAQDEAYEQGIHLQVAKLSESKKGFV